MHFKTFLKYTVFVRLILFLALSILVKGFGYGQEVPEKIDSLIFQLTYLEESPEKVDLLNELGDSYLEFDYNVSEEYGLIAYNLAKKINYKKGVTKAALLLGIIEVNYSTNYFKGIPYLTEVLDNSRQSGDVNTEISALLNFAFINKSNGLFPEAIEYYNKALKLAESNGLLDRANIIYSYIGEVYIEMGEKEKASSYLEKCYLFELDRDFKGTSGSTYYMIGVYFKLNKNYDKTIFYFDKALNFFLSENENRWSAYLYSEYVMVYLELNDLEKAEEYSEKGLAIAEKYDLQKEKLDNFLALAKLFEAQGDLHQSVLYWRSWSLLTDSLQKERIKEQSHQFESSFEKVLNESEISKLKQDKENNELRALNNELTRDIAIGAVVFLVILILLLTLRTRYKSHVAKKINLQQEELSKLSIVASSIEQMVIIVNANDQIEYVNNAYLKFNGFTWEEAIGKKISDLNGGPKTSQETIDEINRSIFEKRQAIFCDLIQYKKDKTWYWARYHITPISDEKGVFEKYIVVGSDATKEIQTEAENKELSLVASKTDNSIIIFDKDIRAIWVNKGFQELTGLTEDFVLGKQPHEFNQGAELAPHEIEGLMKLFHENKAFNREAWGEALDGRRYCISMAITPIFSSNGEVERYISVAADITELKLLEEKYETIVEESTDNICESDLDGRFTFVNESMVNSTLYSKEELFSMHISNLIRKDYVDKVTEFYIHQIKTETRITYLEFPWIDKNGKEYWVGQNTKLKLDPETNEIVGLHYVARDITEKKKAEKALETTFKNAQLLSEIGKQITATLSFDQIIDKVYDNINQLMDASIFGIGIYDEQKNTLDFPAIIENGEKFENFFFDLNDRSRLAVVSFLDNREVIVGNVYKEIKNYTDSGEVVQPVKGKTSLSTIYLPLVQKNKKLGVLTVQSFNENAYDEYHLNIARNIAIYVAIAIDNAGLYQNMEDKVQERTKEVREQKEVIEMNLTNTKILSEIGLEVSSTFDFGEIFENIHQKVTRMMDADIFGVRLYDEINDVVTNKYEIRNGQVQGEVASKITGQENFTAWCLRNRKEVFINNRLTEFKQYTNNDIQDEKGPLSVLYYPMIVDEKLTGVITVQSFKAAAYEPYHLDLLRSLASYIGTALDNAELYETLEQKVAERTEELNQINKDITASINYAKRIQRGILPSDSFMKQLLPDSMVFYKPRDIVSGDFYWMDRKNGKILMAAVDCTGHGVPGALISIIGRNLLDQAVNEKGFTVPSQILNFLQIGMMITFGQNESDKTQVYDGMDISLCTIDLNKMVLEFAGANNPLYVVRNKELMIQKGDKMGISAAQSGGYFLNYEMSIEKGDMIYLFTDGFADQFGGERNKKFTYKRLGDLFLEVSELSCDDQLTKINEVFTSWIGTTQQTDDICIIGAKI